MRLNRNGELWSHLNSIRFGRKATGTFGNTTIATAVAAGVTVLPVAALTNFGVGEPVTVGTGEECEVVKIHASTAPATGNITLDPSTPTQYAHQVGDPVVEQNLTDPGPIADGGPIITCSGELGDISNELQRTLFAKSTGYLDLMIEWGLLGLNGPNIALSLGMLETRVLGTGTPGDPETLLIDLDRVREENFTWFQMLGSRKDGASIRITAMGVDFDPTVFQLQLQRGTKVPIPCRAIPMAGILYEAF